MAGQRTVEVVRDAATVNMWRLEIEGTPFASFSKIDGLSRGVGTVERADGGTGIKVKLSDQVKEYGEGLTFTRVMDPSDSTDLQIETLLTNLMDHGVKIQSAVIFKYHHTRLLRKYILKGLMFVKESHPSLDKVGSGLYEVAYDARCDYWEPEQVESTPQAPFINSTPVGS